MNISRMFTKNNDVIVATKVYIFAHMHYNHNCLKFTSQVTPFKRRLFVLMGSRTLSRNRVDCGL